MTYKFGQCLVVIIYRKLNTDLCLVELSGISGHTNHTSSSAGEQHSSSIDEVDDYLKAARNEESPLLHSAPSDPPVIISCGMERLESLPSGACTDDRPQMVKLAGQNLESVLNVDTNDADDVDDDDDDVGNGHDDDEGANRRQQTGELDSGEIYRAAASNVSSCTALSPADSATSSSGDSYGTTPSNLYCMAAVSEQAVAAVLDSSSTSGPRYWQAQLDCAADSPAVLSRMDDSHSLPGGSEEPAMTPDGCQSPESDSEYCSVKFFTNAVKD